MKYLRFCLVAGAISVLPCPESSAKEIAQDEIQVLPLQGGDDINSATPILTLPFSDSGTTVGYANDYDVACPFTESTAPDVVYSFVPPVSMALDISLCNGTAYDSKLYVFENSPATVIACNDDFCSDYVSKLSNVAVTPGNTYYIIVDGYGDYSGEYVIDVSEHVQCEIVCPSGSIPEGEPDCTDDYVDNTNGGCGSTPIVFGGISCGETICATSGTFLFEGLEYRDTDWFTLVLTGDKDVTVAIEAEFPVQYMIIQQGPPGQECAGLVILYYQSASECVPDSMTHGLSAGNYWIWVAPSTFNGVACGAKYNITVRCVGGCSYFVGDANASNNFNGLDVSYGVSYFKGGPPPPYSCECPPHGTWYVAGDVNGSCNYNGLDVTYAVGFLKGQGPAPVPCPDCPPARMLVPPNPADQPMPAFEPTMHKTLKQRGADKASD